MYQVQYQNNIFSSCLLNNILDKYVELNNNSLFLIKTNRRNIRKLAVANKISNKFEDYLKKITDHNNVYTKKNKNIAKYISYSDSDSDSKLTEYHNIVKRGVLQETNKLQTEVRGKEFEMAICLLYEIEYDGKYKYSLEEATIIKDKLHKLKVEFPFKIKHIAKNGNKYDFVSIDDDKINLSELKLVNLNKIV